MLEAAGHTLPPLDGCRPLEIRVSRPMGYATLARVLVRTYPTRSLLGLALMTSQSFLYNAIFHVGLVLTHFYAVPPAAVPRFLRRAGNPLGRSSSGGSSPIGRRQTITATYVDRVCCSPSRPSSGAGFTATTTIWWSVIFFLASAAASSAYLTVSEIFPLEIRAQAIAFFFAIAQIVGATGPWLFGHLIGDQSHPDPSALVHGYSFGAAMMIAGGLVAAVWGVAAERTALEEICPPLSESR
jgi:hypothetical protein